MPHDRQKERQEIIEMLEAGQSISMLAPRRIGKTWLMTKVADDLRAKGWNAVYIEIAGDRTTTQVVQRLCREIEKSAKIEKRVWAHITQRFNQLTGVGDHSSLVDAISKVDPNDFLETLIEGLEGEDRKTVILIDELALFVLEHARNDRDATHSLLYRLRHLQQKYSKVCWFFTGSVGLDVVAQRYDLRGALVDLQILPLQPFDHTEALSYCLSSEAQPITNRRFEFGEGAFNYLAEQLGWLSPYYLKHILAQVRPTDASKNSPKASVEDIERGIEALLGYQFRNHFSPWGEHLNKNFSTDDRDRLRAILDVLARHSTGELEATLLASEQMAPFQVTTRQLKNDLLILQSDGFIEQEANRWRFRSGLLRRYWLEYEV